MTFDLNLEVKERSEVIGIYSTIATLPQIDGTEIPGPVWALLLRSSAFFGRYLSKKNFQRQGGTL